MTDRVTVRAADLAAHAARLDAAAAAVTAAEQSAAATRPGMDAYGKLCVIVPVLLGQLHGLVVEGIDAAASSLSDTAGRLRTAADGYGAVDQRSAAGVGGAGGGR
jgi:excreted virulence factor EspC (type VII ESX diderm)